mgnify:CR=1 FL=1
MAVNDRMTAMSKEELKAWDVAFDKDKVNEEESSKQDASKKDLKPYDQ